MRLADELLDNRNYSEIELINELQRFHFTKEEARYASTIALGLHLDPERKVVTVLDLNLRSLDLDIASPTVYVPKGRRVEYLNVTENNWFKIDYRGTIGYTHRGNVTSVENYESTEKPKIHEAKLVEPANHKEFVVVIDVNLRTNDADRYRSIALMYQGSKVEHLGMTVNDWFKVRYDGQIGYVHRGDVTSVENYDSKDQTIHAIELTEEANNQEFVSIIDQNIRTADSIQYRALTLIERGESVKHLGTTEKGWFKVDYKGTIGYMYRGDLTSRENYDQLH